MQYEIVELTGGLPVIFSPCPQTPRMALAASLRGGVSREPVPGVAKMAGRLLLKGTERRSADELARELDERAIDVREVVLADCMLLVAVFLTREFDAALDLFADMLLHSTFADFEKETVKLGGEIRASLDLPSGQAHDLLNRTLLGTHPYGGTGTRILESLDELRREQVRDWYTAGLNPHAMNLTLVGDFIPETAMAKLAEHLGTLQPSRPSPTPPAFPPLAADQVVMQPRDDAQQAQVFQGWYAPPLGAETQAATAVMNTIFGGGGLSSRLFRELRDRQGLAYSVHSQYLPMRLTGELMVSIGTSPENITRAREGFAEQLRRLQDEPVTLEELHFGKGKLQGSFVLSHETTSQQCLDMAINHINGLGPDRSEQLLARINAVTIADVQEAARAITPPSVTAIVAPSGSEEITG